MLPHSAQLHLESVRGSRRRSIPVSSRRNHPLHHTMNLLPKPSVAYTSSLQVSSYCIKIDDPVELCLAIGDCPWWKYRLGEWCQPGSLSWHSICAPRCFLCTAAWRARYCIASAFLFRRRQRMFATSLWMIFATLAALSSPPALRHPWFFLQLREVHEGTFDIDFISFTCASHLEHFQPAPHVVVVLFHYVIEFGRALR